ncbi:MAG: hypothetical protein HC808_15840 [Candidatus Competibacteraceae bacterium]|nr:hypothetical protein [Candidatus Competibacteraceae bacterium]
MQAGQQAIERSADMEAIALLTHGLEVLERLPEGPERFQHELTLRCTLGLALVKVRGYAAQEVKTNYARAQTLSDLFKDSPQSFDVLSGLWMFYAISGMIPTALQLAEQSLQIACEEDAVQFIFARTLLGITLFHHGKLTVALDRFEEGIARYDSSLQREMCLRYGQDGGLMCLSFSAHLLWLLGYPEQALAVDHQAMNFAKIVSHPFSEATAIYFSAWHHVLQRDVQLAQARAELAIHLSREQEFPLWLAGATFMHGWALVQLGKKTEGIAQMELAIEGWSIIGTKIGLYYLMVVLAEAYGTVEKPEAGLSVLAKAAKVARDNDEHFYDAELHRIKGELLLQLPVPHKSQAEACFQEALKIARDQQAKSLELRAAMSLCRLWQNTDKRDLGLRELAAVYDWFTEGFDTPDLKDAKTLLDEYRTS